MSAGYSDVLIVERDQAARDELDSALARQGLQASWARTLAEAETVLATRHVCLILFNPRLAPEDGWHVYRQLRRHQVPTVVLARAADPAVKRLALALGADDCLFGDCSAEEVATRARFVLKRVAPRSHPPQRIGGLTLDPATFTATVDGRTVRLTRSEYGLLAALVEAGGRVVPREQLVVRARAHAGALPLARSVDGHVRALRRKLGDDLAQPRLLLSVRGFGYRLADGQPDDSTPLPQLAQAAFVAVPVPAMVLDARQRVRLLNEAAAQLVGHAAGPMTGDLDCATLLQCRRHQPANPCPGRVTLATGKQQRETLFICPQSERLAMEETIRPLPGEPSHLLLTLASVSS